jgi:feruloyl esterase
LSSALWDAQATTLDPESYIPASKIPAIANAVIAACDTKDGVKDGILNDPRQCHFDPAAILCKQANSDSCLTKPQATALKKLYEGAHDASGKQIFPGFMPGAEEGPGGWGTWIVGNAPGKALLFAFGNGFFANMVYDQANWDYKQAKLDDAVAAADKKFAAILNATDANLKPFQSRGGKLIVYHGWNDPGISPLNSINYYDSVVAAMGQPETDSFLRLYMVPGMQHCAGGPGADDFGEFGIGPAPDPQHNIYKALEDWTEKGTAPAAVIATKLSDNTPPAELSAPSASPAQIKMTRLLCPHPQQSKYKGTGNPNQATSFTCATP